MIPIPVSPEQLTRALGWVFDKVAGQVAPPGGAGALLTEAQIDRQLALSCALAGGAGFVSNLGGLLALPVALPANMVGVAAVQLKLIATIAAGRGHPLDSEEVKALSLACLTGSAALNMVKEAGMKAGVGLGTRAVSSLSAAVLQRVNQAVGFRLLAAAGGRGAVNLAKAVPLIGGVIGGGFDAASTAAVGAVARRMFPRIGAEPGTRPAPPAEPAPVLLPPPQPPPESVS